MVADFFFPLSSSNFSYTPQIFITGMGRTNIISVPPDFCILLGRNRCNNAKRVKGSITLSLIIYSPASHCIPANYEPYTSSFFSFSRQVSAFLAVLMEVFSYTSIIQDNKAECWGELFNKALTIGGGGIAGFYIASFIKNKELVLKNKELEVKDQEIAIEKRALEERSKDVEQIEARFKAVASYVMRVHSKDFLEEFEKARKVHNTDFETKEKGFERIVEGLSKSMETVDKKMVDFEKQRMEQAGALGESIKNVLDTGAKMQEAALSLKAVLSSASAVRGRWGEAVLKNLLEQSGLTEGIDFQMQETTAGDEVALRPDVIVNLPGGLQLAIDSKAGLEEFFKAVEEKDIEKKDEHIKKFAQNLREHIKDLSNKEYQKHLDTRIPYVIMFIPGEAAVRAVFEQDLELYREAQEKKVMLASPATIMPLVLLIAHAWKQQKTIENASKLAKEITDLGGRLKTFLGHVVGIGSSLSGATKKFNDAASSWDTRVFPKQGSRKAGSIILYDFHQRTTT